MLPSPIVLFPVTRNPRQSPAGITNNPQPSPQTRGITKKLLVCFLNQDWFRYLPGYILNGQHLLHFDNFCLLMCTTHGLCGFSHPDKFRITKPVQNIIEMEYFRFNTEYPVITRYNHIGMLCILVLHSQLKQDVSSIFEPCHARTGIHIFVAAMPKEGLAATAKLNLFLLCHLTRILCPALTWRFTRVGNSCQFHGFDAIK